jgi:uncharacterized protein Usg
VAELDGRLHSVRIAHAKLIKPFELRLFQSENVIN